MSSSANDPSGGGGLGPYGGAARGILQGVRVLMVGPGAQDRLDALDAALQRDSGLARDAALGGPALALIAFALGPEPDLAVASGPALAAGVPTAARVALFARAPGFDGVTEAQVGGAFAHAFSGVCDLLVVSGLEPFGRRVLELRGDGAPRLCSAAFAPDAELGARARGWAEPALCVGPGADARLTFANVASLTPEPGVPPSFVGRGGLGLAFARAGLAAVLAPAPSGGGDAQAPGAAQRQALHAALGRSPRLRTRAMEGTLELGSARGEVDAIQALSGTPRTKHGCRGCPTPCGWVLQSDGEGPGPVGPSTVGLRYSALREALAAFDDPVAFVARSNELGVDAGAAAEAVRAMGAEAAPERALERLVSGALPEVSRAAAAAALPAAVALPAAALARVHGADRAAAVALLRGARGPEPLRALSLFGLGSAGLGPEGLAQLVAPLPWTAGADPNVDAATLARWHECFAAAVDLSGFCGFSAGALIADGVLDLDELGAALAPARGWAGSRAVEPNVGEPKAREAGAEMLRAGARHLTRHRALRQGTLRRGTQHQGTPTDSIPEELAVAVARYDDIAELVPGSDVPEPEPERSAPRPRPEGTLPEATLAVPVTIVANGHLGDRLRAAQAPSTASDAPPRAGAFEVCAANAREAVHTLSEDLGPGAARWLLSGSGEVLPAVLRAGRVLRLDEPLRAGDALELLLVVPGG